MGSGAAWAGLALWAARRRRRLPFPRHPGEYLLVVLGVTEGLGLLNQFFMVMIITVEVDWIIQIALGIAGLGLCALVLLWPVLAVKSRRWRWFFVMRFALYVVEFLTPLILARTMAPASLRFWLILQGVPFEVLIGVVLIAVVLKDRSGGRRYPWTHWAGVGVQLWFIAFELSRIVWFIVWLRT
jgi:hypothetical protein